MEPMAQTGGSIARSRVEVLDLLRLLAVLAVVLFHYGFRGAAADEMSSTSLPELQPVLKYGFLGVQIFFIISGFVITYSAEGRSASTFAIARVSRIYPGFVFCMTVTFLVTLVIGAPRYETSIAEWVANLVIDAPTFNKPYMDGAYWSIVYEIVFYGWVALLMLAGWLRPYLSGVVVLWLGLSLLNENILESYTIRRLFLTDESGFFAVGILLFLIYQNRLNATIAAILSFAAGVAVYQACSSADWLRDHYAIELDNAVIGAICIVGMVAVALAMQVRHLPIPVGITLALGGLTYPMYLMHQHIGYMLFNRLAGLAHPAILIAAVTAAMLFASLLIWRYFERPAQRWMKTKLTSGLACLFDAISVLPSASGVIPARFRRQK